MLVKTEPTDHVFNSDAWLKEFNKKKAKGGAKQVKVMRRLIFHETQKICQNKEYYFVEDLEFGVAKSSLEAHHLEKSIENSKIYFFNGFCFFNFKFQLFFFDIFWDLNERGESKPDSGV